MNWIKTAWGNLSPFTRAAFMRAFKTVAQTAGAILLTHDRVSGVDWGNVVDVAAMSGLLSILTSVSAGVPESPLQLQAENASPGTPLQLGKETMTMTETQLREHYVNTLRGWIGAKEGDEIHKRIIDTYNSHKPLPRNYPVTYKDAWCAATVSAAATQAGLTDIIPRECSCTRMIELFKKMGRWMERDDHTPLPGDLIFYDWDDSGKGDCTGSADHVGAVEKVAGGMITVIEGNYSDSVKRRYITVNNRFIRGYGLPDYAALAESPPPSEIAVKPQSNGGRIRAMTNAQLADFLSNPPPLAVGQSWLNWLDAAAT